MGLAIFSVKSDHDGTIAGIVDGRLVFSIEAEKNNFPRFSWILPETVTTSFRNMPIMPDVVCLSGWHQGSAWSAKYGGVEEEDVVLREGTFFGSPCTYFSSSHERSHLIGTFGMSTFPKGTPCYGLLWEGGFGCFYEIDENLRITRLQQVISEPGERYAFLYHLARKTEDPYSHGGDAGKLMALAAFSDRSIPNEQEQSFIDRIFGPYNRYSTPKSQFVDSPYYCIGEEHESLKQLAGKLTDALFEKFHAYARQHLTKGLPLLISGGCGLNCEWNSKWRDSGLFSDVYVLPCANDTGSALGTAIDAQYIITGNPKISWNVYAGEQFQFDGAEGLDKFIEAPLSYSEVAAELAAGKVYAWVQGKYEIGPRALGNRSILAAPFKREMLHRLNVIKEREQYRPIAPVCLEDEASQHFDGPTPSPFMLFFQRVKSLELEAVTHVDGTARVQTVSEKQNERMCRLLNEFRVKTGFGVLCNTSLNFKGRGFINQMTDLINFSLARGLDGFVVGERVFRRRDFQSDNL